MNRPALLVLLPVAFACGGEERTERRDPRAPVAAVRGADVAEIVVPGAAGAVQAPAPATPSTPPFAFEVALELPDPEGDYNVMPGFALFDLDGDGDLDLFWPRGAAPALALRNDGGATFVPVEAGLPADLLATSGALGDCDGDGDLDLLATGFGAAAMLRRDGASFAAVEDAGVSIEFNPGGALFFDADGDGDQDLIVTSYQEQFQARLFRARGDCTFEEDDGLPDAPGRAHGATALDVDEDGDTDLLVYHDEGFAKGPDVLLVNDGSGRFRDEAPAYHLDLAAFSMSAEWADLDADGRFDIYTGNICRNVFSRRDGPGAFAQADRALGLASDWIVDAGSPPLVMPAPLPGDPFGDFLRTYATGRPDDDHARCLSAWATPSEDLDADGQRELLVVNGRVGMGMDSAYEPAQLFWRPRGGGTFTDLAAEAGIDHGGRGRTAAFADLDGDGRRDLVLGNVNAHDPWDQPGRVLHNRTDPSRIGAQLLVTLRGPGANTQGVGAIVEVTADGHTQVAYRTLGTSFLASSAAPLHFGLGTATRADVTVRWPWGGGVDHFQVATDAVTLEAGAGR